MVRRKKEVIKPVVAKPLNDTEKRNLVTSFVTSNVNNDETEVVTDYETNNVTKSETKLSTDNDIKNVTINVTQENTKKVTDNVTNKDTIIVTNSNTKSVTNDDTDLITDNSIINATKDITEYKTKKNTKTVTKKVAKKVAVIKTITLGKKDIVAKFTSTNRLRPNYNLSEDTIEVIEKISDILGYKKAEFLDIYLNGTLTKILADLEKNK